MCVVSEIIACDCCGKVINTSDWNWECCLDCGENLCKDCMKTHICNSEKEKISVITKKIPHDDSCAKLVNVRRRYD